MVLEIQAPNRRGRLWDKWGQKESSSHSRMFINYTKTSSNVYKKIDVVRQLMAKYSGK